MNLPDPSDAPLRLDADPCATPPQPDLDMCCGNGCDPCIFDTYDLAMDAYRQSRVARAPTGGGAGCRLDAPAQAGAVVARNPATRRTTSSGCSRCGTWPRPGSTCTPPELPTTAGSSADAPGCRTRRVHAAPAPGSAPAAAPPATSRRMPDPARCPATPTTPRPPCRRGSARGAPASRLGERRPRRAQARVRASTKPAPRSAPARCRRRGDARPR